MNATYLNPSTATPFPERHTRRTHYGNCSLWRKAVPLAIICTVGVSLASWTSYATAQTDVEADPSTLTFLNIRAPAVIIPTGRSGE